MFIVTKVSDQEKKTARVSQKDDKREDRDARMKQVDAVFVRDTLH